MAEMMLITVLFILWYEITDFIDVFYTKFFGKGEGEC